MPLLRSLSSFSLFLDNKSKTSSFIFISSFSLRLRSMRRQIWGQRRDKGERSPTRGGLKGGFDRLGYRWSRPDANRETTRGLPGPFVGLISTADPGDFAEQRCYAALSSPSTARQTQPLPLPPPHVAAPSPDKVSCSFYRSYRVTIIHYCWGISGIHVKDDRSFRDDN